MLVNRVGDMGLILAVHAPKVVFISVSIKRAKSQGTEKELLEKGSAQQKTVSH